MFYLNAVVISLLSIVTVDNTATIPLDKIWALNTPKTKSIHKLLKDPKDDNSFVGEIARTFHKKYGKKVGPAFVVNGEGAEALKNAHAVITEKEKRNDKTAQSNAKSIFFFTHYARRFIHVKKVDMEANTIKIYFQEVPHENANMTVHFALIPLGKLHRGKYSVEIIPLPLDKRWSESSVKPYDDSQREKKICSSFKFEVT